MHYASRRSDNFFYRCILYQQRLLIKRCMQRVKLSDTSFYLIPSVLKDFIPKGNVLSSCISQCVLKCVNGVSSCKTSCVLIQFFMCPNVYELRVLMHNVVCPYAFLMCPYVYKLRVLMLIIVVCPHSFYNVSLCLQTTCPHSKSHVSS